MYADIVSTQCLIATVAQVLLQIGPYKLGQAVRDYPDARKLSWWSNLLWGHKTAGETLYRCPDTVRFLNGEKQTIIAQLEKEMIEASKDKHYERAAQLRDEIKALTALGKRVPTESLSTINGFDTTFHPV